VVKTASAAAAKDSPSLLNSFKTRRSGFQLKNEIQWIKVSMVSGILVAGLFSQSSFAAECRITDGYDPQTAVLDPADAFEALVFRYSIERRQWVEIGLWICCLENADDNPATKFVFYPSGVRTRSFDARRMTIYWRGDRELFARECEAWIESSIASSGMVNRLFPCGARSGGSSIPDEHKVSVNRAFDGWCRELLTTEV
jgi:hypothetical protein